VMPTPPLRRPAPIPDLHRTTTMPTGFDTTSNVAAQLPCLAKTCNFIARYYATKANAWKVVDRAEAVAISAAGVSLVVVYQNTNNSAAYFTKANGKRDAAEAHAYASTIIDQPSGTPIYFAVDYDASTADIKGGVTDYFQAIQAEFTAKGGAYSAGVYGSGAVCTAMTKATFATHTWLASAAEWAGTATYKAWNIKQLAQKTVCSITGDPNTGNDNHGGFKVDTSQFTSREERAQGPDLKLALGGVEPREFLRDVHLTFAEMIKEVAPLTDEPKKRLLFPNGIDSIEFSVRLDPATGLALALNASGPPRT
jgi:hypothetical protein